MVWFKLDNILCCLMAFTAHFTELLKFSQGLKHGFSVQRQFVSCGRYSFVMSNSLPVYLNQL